MGKPKKRPNGPYLSAACFCDNIVIDERGAATLVRIIDSVTVSLKPQPDQPIPDNASLPVPITVWAFFAFKKGGSGKKHILKLIMEPPGGETRRNVLERQLDFRAEEHGGSQLRLQIGLVAQRNGVYWLSVYLDNKFMTSLPLNVLIQREDAPTKPSKSKSKPAAERKKD